MFPERANRAGPGTVVTVFEWSGRGLRNNPQPVDHTDNVTNAPAPVAGAVFGNGPAVKTSAIRTT